MTTLKKAVSGKKNYSGNLEILPRIGKPEKFSGKYNIFFGIIPRVRVGYELAIIISYPTSANEIITVLLKTPSKYREFFATLFVKTTDFQLAFNFEQTRTVTIFEEHGIMAHKAKPVRALELYYSMIQFLLILVSLACVSSETHNLQAVFLLRI